MTVRERLAEWLRPAEKASTGIGAMWMTHQPQLSSFLKDPRKAMAQAQDIGRSNLYIRACERVISDRFGTVEWHLEDSSDEAIESGPIIDLMERPYRPQKGDPVTPTPQTRSGLWKVTSRHMGLCGNAFWYLDQTNALAGIPAALLYVNPSRMWPAVDRDGNLLDWVLDADNRGGGMPLGIDNVLHFRLEPPDEGHFGIGLVESAYSRVELMRLVDHHARGVLASGGRLAGVFSPPAQAGAIPEDQYQQLVKDIRTVGEISDSARRSLVLRGPIEFTKTTANPSELDLTAMAMLGRDGILDLWGVPLSQLGGGTAAGLNSGESRKYDEASLWQNAVGPRLRAFRETVQFGLLDRLASVGQAVEMEIEEPEFDDDAPAYAMAASATSLPLTNAERRAIIGLDPIGDPAIDDAVWLPINIGPVGVPVSPMGIPPRRREEDEEVTKARAVTGTDAVRRRTEQGMAADLERVFAKMQREVAAKVRRNAKHLETHPNDVDVWWDAEKWEKELLAAIRPHALNAADATVEKVEALLA